MDGGDGEGDIGGDVCMELRGEEGSGESGGG